MVIIVKYYFAISSCNHFKIFTAYRIYWNN